MNEVIVHDVWTVLILLNALRLHCHLVNVPRDLVYIVVNGFSYFFPTLDVDLLDFLLCGFVLELVIIDLGPEFLLFGFEFLLFLL